MKTELLDIKEENIGYKMCKNGPVFTFLDFGSFFDKNQSSVIATFNVNRKYFNEGKISNDLLVVFGTIMTLLSLRLSVIDRNLSKKFRNFVKNSNSFNWFFAWPNYYFYD